jgi:hypothetical protein
MRDFGAGAAAEGRDAQLLHQKRLERRVVLARLKPRRAAYRRDTLFFFALALTELGFQLRQLPLLCVVALAPGELPPRVRLALHV